MTTIRKYVMVDDIIIRTVELPELVKTAIAEKLVEEHILLKYDYTANRINLHFRKNVETTFVPFVPLVPFVFIFEYLSYRDCLISIILILLSLRCRASWLRSNGDCGTRKTRKFLVPTRQYSLGRTKKVQV